MKKGTKGSRRFIVVFCITVFWTTIATIIIVNGTFAVLFRSGILDVPRAIVFLINVTIFSAILSTIIARIVGDKIFAPVHELNRATKEVAKGNFNVSLNEDINIYEIKEMAHNFNIMTKELQSTEIVHNDFTRNVSHEFKTPLSAIEGYATLLQAKNIDDDKRLFYASKIIAGTRRLSILTGNILELSRLENKQVGLEKQKFSLDEQLRQVILLYEKEWTEKKLDIDVDLPEVYYYGNEDFLYQVWQNIFGNAVKFSDENGKIRIFIEQNDNFISVSIADSGIGISEEDKGRIFEKFYQGDKSHSTSGNGLGLAISREIIELHGGQIRVSSEKEKGTTFIISLPIHKEEAGSPK